MFAAKYLVWLIILLPLLGGLYLVIFKPQDRQIQRRWTSLTLLGAGLAGLVRFILSGEAACTNGPGEQLGDLAGRLKPDLDRHQPLGLEPGRQRGNPCGTG
ncbi:MAG: hypothetical protein P8Y37_10225 [Anaerolineales bacterium]